MNTALIRSDWVGRTVGGRFPLLECLGESGPSVLFRTELRETSSPAAIRLIPADAENSASLRSNWAASANLSHPHLMWILHSGQDEIDGTRLFYVVTEYAEEALSQVIPERPLTSDEAREMVKPVLDALEYLHGKGIVFGHLKPSNIMVVENQLKLPLDNIQGANSRGEPRVYNAPESATGAISPASDIWSLGVTLVEALTQLPPVWDRSTTRDPLVPESVPQPFADIARQSLRLNPADRTTLGAIRRRLDGVAEPVAQPKRAPAAAPAPPVEVPERTTRSKLPMPAFVVAGLVLLALIVFMIVRSRRSEPPAPTATEAPAPTRPSGPPTTSDVPEQAAPQPSAPSSSATKGEVSERVMPDVTAAASRTIHGKVLVKIRVTVDADGAVSSASIDSSGGSRYFAGKALEAAQKWRFRPAPGNGQPVASVWTVAFEFRQNGISSSASQVSP